MATAEILKSPDQSPWFRPEFTSVCSWKTASFRGSEKFLGQNFAHDQLARRWVWLAFLAHHEALPVPGYFVTRHIVPLEE